jgi:hypothetical protein
MLTRSQERARSRPSTAVVTKADSRHNVLGGDEPSWLLKPESTSRQLDVTLSDRRSEIQVTFSENALVEIEAHASKRGWHTEEGGLLIATRSGANRWRVVDASGPGANSRRTKHRYVPDHLADAQFLNAALATAPDGRREAGCWHTHVAGTHADTQPSEPDLQAFARSLDETHVDRFIGLICAPGENGISANCWITERAGAINGQPWYRCGPAAKLTIDGDSRRWTIR